MSNNAQTPYNPLVRKTGTQQGRALDAIAASGFGQQHVGNFTKPLPGGVSVVSDNRGRSSGNVAHPFKGKRRNDEGIVEIEPGTINGKFATSYQVSVGASGVVYVYAQIIPTFTDIEGYIISWDFENFTIASAATVPDDTTENFYKPLCVYTDGVKVAQVVQNSLDVVWCGMLEAPQARYGLSG
jgi:hypothetical protein